jgi:DNA polymerase III alpha subunit
MLAISLTDHGSMAGAVQLWQKTRGTRVKPVIGCEVYVADDRKAHTKGNPPHSPRSRQRLAAGQSRIPPDDRRKGGGSEP